MTKSSNDVKNKILNSLVSQMGGSKKNGSKKNGSKKSGKKGTKNGSLKKISKKGSKLRESKKGSLKKISKKGSKKGSNRTNKSKRPKMMSGLARALNDTIYNTNDNDDNIANIHPQNDNENDPSQNKNEQSVYTV